MKRRRDVNVSVWVDSDEAGLLERAAYRADDPISTWIRKTALRRARADEAKATRAETP